MLGYSIMLSMAKKYGFRTFLDELALLNLERYFQNIRNVSKLESLCFTEYPWIDYLQSPQNLAIDKTLSVGHAIQYCKEVNFSHISSLSDIIRDFSFGWIMIITFNLSAGYWGIT